MPVGEHGDVVEIAYAPGRVLRPQIGVERRVASAGMHVRPRGTGHRGRAAHRRLRTRAAPAISPWVAVQGAIWTMLIATTASAWTTGQVSAAASSDSGGNRFGRPVLSRQAAMLFSASGSWSVGCHVSAGNALLNHTACSPVPLAISSTSADGGKHIAQHPQDRLAITRHCGCGFGSLVHLSLGLRKHRLRPLWGLWRWWWRIASLNRYRECLCRAVRHRPSFTLHTNTNWLERGVLRRFGFPPCSILPGASPTAILFARRPGLVY